MRKKKPTGRKKIRIRIVFENLGDKAPNGRNSTRFGEYHTQTGLIKIDPRQGDLEMMDTLIHEILHALYPMMHERVVSTNATKITKILWKLGYRPTKKFLS